MHAEEIRIDAQQNYTIHLGHEELVQCLTMLLRRPLFGFIEVGSANGGSFHCWGRAIPKGPKVSVDWNQGFGNGLGGTDAVHEGDCRPVYDRNTKWRSFFTDVRIVEGNSLQQTTVDACRTILRGEQVDWLFIDADHTYTAAQHDLENYSPFVRRGGYIGFHDIRFNTEMQTFWTDIKRVHEHRRGRVFEFPDSTYPNVKSNGIGILQL